MTLIIQFATLSNMLYIVPTPIGNLKDITLRALEVLQSADGIICEDSRRTSLLLNHYQIKKPLEILNDYNEARLIPIIMERLDHEDWALVSDAGTPLISDPGYKLVRECIHRGIKIDSLPGPSAVITALTLSGLPPDRFLFVGYPPEKSGKRIKWLKDFKKTDSTVVMFISPHKILTTLSEMKEVLGDIEVTLAHELTKIHQSVDSKRITEWLKSLKKQPAGRQGPKGEYVLLLRSS